MKSLAEPIVDAAVEIYGRMSKDLLPTPAKSHYIFNLRDLSKCVQGMSIQCIHYSVTECSRAGTDLLMDSCNSTAEKDRVTGEKGPATKL